MIVTQGTADGQIRDLITRNPNQGTLSNGWIARRDTMVIHKVEHDEPKLDVVLSPANKPWYRKHGPGKGRY